MAGTSGQIMDRNAETEKIFRLITFDTNRGNGFKFSCTYSPLLHTTEKRFAIR